MELPEAIPESIEVVDSLLYSQLRGNEFAPDVGRAGQYEQLPGFVAVSDGEDRE